MKLRTTGTRIQGDAPHIRSSCVIDPARAAAVLQRQGYRHAEALAHGALNTPSGARALARAAGLLTVENGCGPRRWATDIRKAPGLFPRRIAHNRGGLS